MHRGTGTKLLSGGVPPQSKQDSGYGIPNQKPEQLLRGPFARLSVCFLIAGVPSYTSCGKATTTVLMESMLLLVRNWRLAGHVGD